MMTLEAIREAKEEALKFVSATNKAIGRLGKAIRKNEFLPDQTARQDAEKWLTISSKETAALRRASMDLTRALSKLRSSKREV